MLGDPILVMLVEDNADHAELVIRTMESHHIPTKIQHLTDGESALDYLLRRNNFKDPETSPRPHIILLDLRLPRVDGLEVLRMIKEEKELRNIPVVILTTSTNEADRDYCLRNGADAYYRKPDSIKELVKIVRVVLNNYLNEQHL